MSTTCHADVTATLAHRSPRMPLAGLLALATAAFTDVMTDLLPAGSLPQMSRALNVSEARIGLLVSAFAAASALAAIPVTAAVRSLPRRPVLTGVLVGFAVLNAVTAVSSSYPLTFAVRLLAGIMGGTLWSMLAGYAARMVPAHNRGRAIAIVLAGITAALSLGLPAGAALANVAGWRAGFASLSVVALLLVAWVRRTVPPFPGEARLGRTPPLRVACQPGIRTILAVTLVLLIGHQAMYTYIAPFATSSGFGHVSLVLLVFGTATAGGIAVTGLLADRHLRPVLLAALALVMTAMLALGSGARIPAVLLPAVALWGVAFGGAPTLLQTALTDASGPGHADMATSMQTTVYNIGIAAGSLAGGLILQRAGAGTLPWATSLLSAAALAAVATMRRHAFPAGRTGAEALLGAIPERQIGAAISGRLSPARISARYAPGSASTIDSTASKGARSAPSRWCRPARNPGEL
jgi:predicted MFS family arabinose efflux permease